MSPEVMVNLSDIALKEHVFIAPYLGMTETVVAECKTVLCLYIENKLALRILVLTAFYNFQFSLVVDE
jgi:hypothetical protein